MATDMFIKIGDLADESKDKDHKGETDVLAWSWGASNSGSAHVGGGAGSGKASFQDLSFTKYISKSSPKLFLACATGKHFADATLVCRKAGDKPLEYLKFKLTEVLVTSYSTGGSGGEDRLTENVTLNFAKIEMTYNEQGVKGAGAGDISAGYNISENAAV